MPRSKQIPHKDKHKRKSFKFVKMDNRIYKIGSKTFKEIKRLQTSTTLAIPKSPFARLVHEILQGYPQATFFRIQRLALEALHEASEIYLTGLMQDANLCSMHARRATLRVNDIQLVLNLRGPWDPAYLFSH